MFTINSKGSRLLSCGASNHLGAIQNYYISQTIAFQTALSSLKVVFVNYIYNLTIDGVPEEYFFVLGPYLIKNCLTVV